ncbi:MAG: hypothetical protein AABZ80_12225 [Gemmatimonadota bacterium]
MRQDNSPQLAHLQQSMDTIAVEGAGNAQPFIEGEALRAAGIK